MFAQAGDSLRYWAMISLVVVHARLEITGLLKIQTAPFLYHFKLLFLCQSHLESIHSQELLINRRTHFAHFPIPLPNFFAKVFLIVLITSDFILPESCSICNNLLAQHRYHPPILQILLPRHQLPSTSGILKRGHWEAGG